MATGPDGEITPLDRERAMNSYNAPRFCESGQLGSGQSEQGINCLYPKLDRLEDQSSCLRLKATIKSTNKSLFNLQLIPVTLSSMN